MKPGSVSILFCSLGPQVSFIRSACAHSEILHANTLSECSFHQKSPIMPASVLYTVFPTALSVRPIGRAAYCYAT